MTGLFCLDITETNPIRLTVFVQSPRASSTTMSIDYMRLNLDSTHNAFVCDIEAVNIISRERRLVLANITKDEPPFFMTLLTIPRLTVRAVLTYLRTVMHEWIIYILPGISAPQY